MSSFRNNKCEITFRPDNTVKKRFFKKKRNQQHFDILREIHDLFPSATYGGWSYKTVKPLYFDQNDNAVVMEYVEGQNLGELFITKPDLCLNAGLWLALFHQNSTQNHNELVCFGDFHRNNLLVNTEKREITAIDPNKLSTEKNQKEYDIYSMIFSLAVGSFKSIKMPNKYVKLFLQGYRIINKDCLDKTNILKCHRFLVLRHKRKEKHQARKVLFYFSRRILSAYLKLFIHPMLTARPQEPSHV